MDEQLKTRAVIFDMDGVLVDSEPLINAAAIAMFKEKGLTVRPDDFLPFVGMGEERYVGGVAEKYNLHLDTVEAKRRTYEIYLDFVPSRLEPFPGVLDFVHSCRGAGILTAVASSADEIKVRANLEKIRLPVEFWDAVVWGEEVKKKETRARHFFDRRSKTWPESTGMYGCRRCGQWRASSPRGGNALYRRRTDVPGRPLTRSRPGAGKNVRYSTL
jgi:beta-phosphoglucomutase-like phosphatase (HAD superfamily)